MTSPSRLFPRGRSGVWRNTFGFLALTLCCQTGCAGDPPEPLAGSALGDWGHFLSMRPRIHVDNPDGRAFTLTFHTMLWPVAQWNPDEVAIRVDGPDGEPVVWELFAVDGSRIILELPAGEPGVYTVDWGRKPGNDEWRGPNFWLETDLPRSVVWTGDPATGAPSDRSAVEQRRPFFQASVPRRWWFWVPDDVDRFVVRAQRTERHMSQREAWGLTVFSPRGQRMEVLWGQPPRTARAAYRQEMERVVEVVPGSGGRFWYIEVRNGDAHHFANVNFTFEGIPPYIARSPEAWFDGSTGERPPAHPYDKSSFVQAAYEPEDPERRPHLEHWTPTPALGDPDGSFIRGGTGAALWNPEGRPLRFALGAYLSRDLEGEATVVFGHPVSGAREERRMPVPHYHEGVDPPEEAEFLGEVGVHLIDVSGAARWWAFTYPATPVVLRGVQTGRRSAFHLEVGNARNWYFFVPPGTGDFTVRASTGDPAHHVLVEVNAPDRVVEIIHGPKGARRIEVPAGLDGKVWHLRTDIGSASRLHTGDDRARPRYLSINLSLELEGVPPFLSPTWEQWFDPSNPEPAFARGATLRR